MSSIRVFLVDDHSVLRQGLRLLINSQRDMEVVGEHDRGRGVTEVLRNARADVLIMDVSMPGMSGADAAVAVRNDFPYVKIIGLSRHSEKAYVQQMMQAGCTGYVLKQTPVEALIAAIRSVASGGTYIDPAVAAKLVDVPVRLRAGHAGDALLSGREQEIVTMVAYGHTNKEIAATLGIAVKTVEAHKANIMQKLDIATRADLVRFAISKGWLEL